MSDLCHGCGEPIEFHSTTKTRLDKNGKERSVDCFCSCHENKCTKSCEDADCDVNADKGPCKGECGCHYCHNAYQDFLSSE